MRGNSYIGSLQEKILRLTEERNNARSQLLSQQEKLKRAQTRNQRMTRISREQEKILQKLKNESNDGEHRRRHHRYVSLRPKSASPPRPRIPGNPRNRDLEEAYAESRHRERGLTAKVDKLSHAKNLLQLRLDVVDSRLTDSLKPSERLTEAANEEALRLVASLQTRLLKALQDKRNLQAKALEVFDRLTAKKDVGIEEEEDEEKREEEREGGDAKKGEGTNLEWWRNEVQRLHAEISDLNRALSASEKDQMRLVRKLGKENQSLNAVSSLPPSSPSSLRSTKTRGARKKLSRFDRERLARYDEMEKALQKRNRELERARNSNTAFNIQRESNLREREYLQEIRRLQRLLRVKTRRDRQSVQEAVDAVNRLESNFVHSSPSFSSTKKPKATSKPLPSKGGEGKKRGKEHEKLTRYEDEEGPKSEEGGCESQDGRGEAEGEGRADQEEPEEAIAGVYSTHRLRLMALEAKISTRDEQLKEAECRIIDLNKLVDTFTYKAQAQSEQSEKEKMSLKSRVESLIKDKERLEDRLGVLEKEGERLKSQHAAVMQGFEGETSELADQVTALQDQLKNADVEVEQLRQSVNEKDASCETVSRDLEKRTVELNVLKEEMDGVRRKLSEALQRENDLKETLKDMEQAETQKEKASMQQTDANAKEEASMQHTDANAKERAGGVTIVDRDMPGNKSQTSGVKESREKALQGRICELEKRLKELEKNKESQSKQDDSREKRDKREEEVQEREKEINELTRSERVIWRNPQHVR